jgi:hypothetical protein
MLLVGSSSRRRYDIEHDTESPRNFCGCKDRQFVHLSALTTLDHFKMVEGDLSTIPRYSLSTAVGYPLRLNQTRTGRESIDDHGSDAVAELRVTIAGDC